MSIRSSSSKLTYRDLLRMPEDSLRHELIGGEHFMSPSPRVDHQRCVVNLTLILASFARATRRGEVLVGPTDIVFSDHDVLVPDLLFIGAEHAGRVGERCVAGAPDLVVEVLSPSRRGYDKIKKRRVYEENGVAEYWIVDPAAAAVEVYRRDGGRFVCLPGLSRAAGDRLETPLLPGLSIPLAEIFG